MIIPADVEYDITRVRSILQYLPLSDLRLMACLDIIVKRWRETLVEGIANHQQG